MKTLELLLAWGVYALFRPFVLFFLLLLYGWPASAQTVYWDFSGGSLSGQSTDPYIVPEDAYTGPGVSTNGFPDEACSNGEPWSVRGWYNTSSIFQAINRGDYVAFSLSVSPGYNYHITGISFMSNRSTNSTGSDRGPRIWAVYSSHDNYSNVLFSGRNSTGETGTSAACDFHSDAVDIRLRGGESVTFRIYAYSDATSEISTMRIDDFTVDGTELPIQLGTFSAREEGGKVLLSWQTEMEQDNAYMAVERSADGHRFREIGRVAGAGTTNERQEYSYVDDNPLPGVNYYRLRQVDFDGTEEIHRVVSVQMRSAAGPIRFFPSLTDSQLSIRFPEAPERAGTLYIFDTFGRTIRQITTHAGALQQDLNVSELIPGTYVLQYRAGRENRFLGRFVKK